MNGAVAKLSNKIGITKLQFPKWKNAILSHIDFKSTIARKNSNIKNINHFQKP